MSAHANARRMYGHKKVARAKEEKTIMHSERALQQVRSTPYHTHITAICTQLLLSSRLLIHYLSFPLIRTRVSCFQPLTSLLIPLIC